jgi:uncharacterized protein YndB with AHSA1/START domain
MTTASPGTAETSAASTTTAVFRVYIKTTPQAIWTAITDPSWTRRYGYGGYANYDLRPGGTFTFAPDEDMKAGAESMGVPKPDVIIDGEVLEVDEPWLLRTTWRMLMDPNAAKEGFTTLTHEIRQIAENYCSLTVTHECENAPSVLAMVSGAGDATPEQGGGGHPWILSDLKTLLESGTAMTR